MFRLLDGVIPYPPEDVNKYTKRRWWSGLTLGDLLDRAADIHPDKVGFVDTQSRITYSEARENADLLAIGMMDMGICPSDRVLIQLPNWHEFVFSYFACQKIGAIPVLLIDRYRQHEIGHLIELSGASAWIAPRQYKKVDFLPIIEDIQRDYPQIRHVITVRGNMDRPGFSSVEALIAQSQPTEENLKRLAACKPNPMQVAHMGPTGGTTGKPKLVPRTHESLVCGIQYCSASWEQHCEDVNLIAGPIGHDLSFSKGFMGSVITQGRVILLDTTDNEAICQTIEKERVTSIIWVPTLAQRLLQYPSLHRHDLRSLRKMHSAGGASHPGLVQEVMEKLKMKFFNGYGGTEGMTCITRTTDPYDTICGTVGRPTCPYDTYKVVDVFGKTLPPNTPGELLLKGPCVFTGYYRNPEENAQVFDAEGFFKTGDVARISERGYITLVGRIKEMINRGGESISATEIETLISRHPEVAVVAVIPMSDSLMGERVCAYIEPVKGARLSFEAVISFLKDQKASVLQLPERIEFVDTMPYTAAQKLNKQLLRQDIEKKLKESLMAA